MEINSNTHMGQSPREEGSLGTKQPVVCFTFVDPAAKAGDVQAQQLLQPKRASHQAAGYDLVAANPQPIPLDPGERALVPTGIALALPQGLEAQVRPRSGLALRHGVTCLNAPGTIDADYRGEVGVILVNHGKETLTVKRGMRVAQLVIASVVSIPWELRENLSASGRGTGGFGSTGVTAQASPQANPLK